MERKTGTLTEAEAKARDERLRAAGITPRRETTGTITLLRKPAPVEDLLEDDDGSGVVE